MRRISSRLGFALDKGLQKATKLYQRVRRPNTILEIGEAVPARSTSPLKLLAYAPYTQWSVHTAKQVTILHAMRLRGHHVEYVMCDGIFTQCDIHRTGLSQEHLRFKVAPDAKKTPLSCLECQWQSRLRLVEFGTESLPVSRWSHSSERFTARQWSAKIPTHELRQAAFKDWPVAEWIVSSVHSHFRANSLDLGDPLVEEIFRRYLESGLVACFALDRMLAVQGPDLLLLFNGRMSSTRIALELAKRRGIRTIVEERARVPGYIRLIENENCLYLGYLDWLWQQWKGTPLSEQECQAIVNLLGQRARGESFEIRRFAAPRSAQEPIRARLRLDDRPIWLLLTSSIDESITEDRASGLFESQNEWIERLVGYASSNPDIQLIVRVHPNIGSANSVGRNEEDIAYFKGLAEHQVENVRVIQSDDEISTYTLMDMSDAGFIWHSIAGLEMAARGKHVFRSGGWFMKGKEFLTELGPQNLDEVLNRARNTSPQDGRVMRTRLALRCAFIWFYRQSYPFPLVSQPDWGSGALAYNSLEALLPGKSEPLDEICSIFTGEKPLHRGPTAEESARSTVDEDKYLELIASDSQF